jgi:RNA polymerase sigma-70 factor (ECF subfamily)
LYKIAYHCFLAHKRAAKPEQTLGDEEPPEQATDGEDALDLHRDFARALLAFPPDQRMTLHLHFQKEMTHQEVSDLLGLPLGTVKSHIQRGREKLAARLEGWQIGEAV